jgi:hypothetical protein
MLAIGLQVALAAPAVAAPGLAAPAVGDSDIVFCLSADQRPHLVEAAVSLGLARSAGRPDQLDVPARGVLTIDDWSRDRGEDFRRACRALVDASRTLLPAPGGAGTGPLAATLLVLLPVFAGVLLTGGVSALGSWWRNAAARRAAMAAALRSSMGAFSQAVETYLDAWLTQAGDPTAAAAPLAGLRSASLAAARQVVAAYPRWRLPRELQAAASADGFGAALTAGWQSGGNPHKRRLDRVARVRADLRALETTAERLARALERPGIHADLGSTRRKERDRVSGAAEAERA